MFGIACASAGKRRSGGDRVARCRRSQINGQFTSKEHFGYTDGFGNPEFLGLEKDTQPGQGKLTADGKWTPLATGELLLEYADEAGELPVAPLPHLLACNGTFMVYRKLHQNVKTFREYLKREGRTLSRRSGEAGFEIHRQMARRHPGGIVAG